MNLIKTKKIINDKFCGWTNALQSRENFKVLNKNFKCDYLVIGAGYTGLSAARKLSEINSVKLSKVYIKNDSLYKYHWPGNVRELRNLVERITILSSNETQSNINKLIEDILNPSSSYQNKNLIEKSFSSPLKEARKHFEKEYLTTQLKKNHGNISKTADFIGMERSALHRKLKELGIKGIN